jgi:hypothetical protein
VLRGFMDQVTPSRDHISTFYKADFASVRSVIDGLLEEMDFNNYCFYTKWYTNGIKSGLPFLTNHPDSLNVRTDNKALRQIFDYLHMRGLSVSAMLQIYTFERDTWGDAPIWGEWDLRHILSTDQTEAVADPTSDVYKERLAAMIQEQLTLFPDIDYLMIEGEGLTRTSILQTALQGHESLQPENLTFASEVSRYCERLSLPLEPAWAQKIMDFMASFRRSSLQIVEDVADSVGFKGRMGVVYHIYGPESWIVESMLPSKRWILIPWHYYGWDAGFPPAVFRERVDAGKRHLSKMHSKGYEVFYLGDATITGTIEPIEEMWKHVVETGLAGYFAMGTPNVDLGLRWGRVTDEQVARVRELYRTRIFPRVV